MWDLGVNWARQGGITFFGMHVFVLCCLVLLFRAGHLIVSWFMTAHRYMLDLLGDITSNVSFCQLSGGVCYPTICMHRFSLHMGLSDILQCEIMHICIIFCPCLILFCIVLSGIGLHFVYKVSPLMESVY